MLAKLKSNSGESIAEVLVTAIIISLATLLFVNMVSTSTRIIERSEDSSKEYYGLKNAFEQGVEGDYDDAVISVGSIDNVTLSYGVNSNLYLNVNPAKKYELPVTLVTAQKDNLELLRYKKVVEDEEEGT